MIVTEKNGEYYCYGKIMSKEEILSKLKNLPSNTADENFITITMITITQKDSKIYIRNHFGIN